MSHTTQDLSWVDNDLEVAINQLANTYVAGREKRAAIRKLAEEPGFFSNLNTNVVQPVGSWLGSNVTEPISNLATKHLGMGDEAAKHLGWGLAGAGAGSALGLGSSLFSSEKKRRPLSSMLAGGILGGAAGAGGSLIHSQLPNIISNAPDNTAEEEGGITKAVRTGMEGAEKVREGYNAIVDPVTENVGKRIAETEEAYNRGGLGPAAGTALGVGTTGAKALGGLAAGDVAATSANRWMARYRNDPTVLGALLDKDLPIEGMNPTVRAALKKEWDVGGRAALEKAMTDVGTPGRPYTGFGGALGKDLSIAASDVNGMLRSVGHAPGTPVTPAEAQAIRDMPPRNLRAAGVPLELHATMKSMSPTDLAHVLNTAQAQTGGTVSLPGTAAKGLPSDLLQKARMATYQTTHPAAGWNPKTWWHPLWNPVGGARPVPVGAGRYGVPRVIGYGGLLGALQYLNQSGEPPVLSDRLRGPK